MVGLAFCILITEDKIKPTNLKQFFSSPGKTGSGSGPIPVSALPSAPVVGATAASSASPSENKSGVWTLKVIREELW